MVTAGKYWSFVLTLCGASVVAVVAVAQQAATEAPTGFDTPTLVENPGSQSVSNGIAEPAGDSFAQSSWCRWMHNIFDDYGRLTATRVYFAIPTSGTGTSGVNDNETDFAYDSLGRRNKTVSPGGTITRTVFEARGFALAVYVGTNDAGATDADPTGGGATGDPDGQPIMSAAHTA